MSTNTKIKTEKFFNTKEALYWYITACSSLIFFFVSNMIKLLDPQKAISMDQETAAALMGTAFGLTISAFVELFRHFPNDPTKTKIDLISLAKIIGGVGLGIELIIFTMCNTIDNINYSQYIKYGSAIFTISALL